MVQLYAVCDYSVRPAECFADTVTPLPSTCLCYQGVTDVLRTYGDRVNAIARSLPNQPPVANITDNLQGRSQELGVQSRQLMPSIVEFMNQPSKIAAAGISDFNNDLELLLRDLNSQSSRGPELAKVLAEGPLANIPRQINTTMGNVAGSFQVGWCC